MKDKLLSSLSAFCLTRAKIVSEVIRDAPIPDTDIGIGHLWWYQIGIGYSVSIQYHNRYYYDVI